jgi:hypothetical protein
MRTKRLQLQSVASQSWSIARLTNGLLRRCNKRVNEPRQSSRELPDGWPIMVSALLSGLLVFAAGGVATAWAERTPGLVVRALPAFWLVTAGMLVAGGIAVGVRRLILRAEPEHSLAAGAAIVSCALLCSVLMWAIAAALGVRDPFPLDIVGAAILTWALVRVAPNWTGFDEPLALLPGFVLGAALTWWVEDAYALSDSIVREFMDPNAILLAATAGLSLAVGPALASFFRQKRAPRPGLLVGVCALGGAVALLLANRLVLVPRLYHFAHIALAFFEFAFVAGALGWLLPRAPRSTSARAGAGAVVVVALMSVVSALLPWRAGSRHIDVAAGAWGMLATPLTDLDGDGYAGTWAAGADAHDLDPRRHPFTPELASHPDADRNGNGVVAALPMDVSATDVPSGTDLVVVVTIDMLRPDYLQPYGAEQETSPRLNELAAEGIVFDRAYSAGGITTMSLPALIRGRYPLALDMEPVFRTTGRRYVFPEDVAPDDQPNRVFLSARSDPGPTIGSLVEEVGGKSFAVLDDGPARVFQQGLGYEKGFDVIRYPNAPEGPGEDAWDAVKVTDAALDVLAAAPERSFVWVHYYDPHAAFPPCDRFEPTPGLGCYRDAIYRVDHQIGRLVDALKESGRWERTAIFVSSDHGEALGEHGLSHHGLDSFEEFVRIPLIARWPGVARGRESRPVSLLDISHSSVALLGAAPPATWHGAPLWTTQRRYPVLSQTMLTAVDGMRYRQQNLLVDGDRRVMWDRISHRSWVYDVDDDPGQTRPVDEPEAWREVARWVDAVEREED